MTQQVFESAIKKMIFGFGFRFFCEYSGLKGLRCNYIKILCKNFVGHLFKRNKISNEDTLVIKSPQWELSDDVLHIPIACVLVELLTFKIYATHE